MRVGVLLVLVACSYTPVTSPGSMATDGAPSPEASVVAPDASPPPPPPECTIGERVCVDATHSGVCDPQHVPTTDRDCPPGSPCAAGFCAPPSGARPCAVDTDCSGQQVCDLYVVGGTLTGFCTDKLGGNTGSCAQQGNDPDCETGICASKSDGADRLCLSPCTSSCPNSSDQCTDLGQPTTIEGTSTVGQRYCVPD